MITDTEIKIKGMEALIAKLGEVQAERFISLIMREPFDYTKWHKRYKWDLNWLGNERRICRHLASRQFAR